MLIFSRHKNERIDITTEDGTRIVVTVVETRKDKTRIGIEAPRSVTVHRREVTEAIELEQAAVA